MSIESIHSDSSELDDQSRRDFVKWTAAGLSAISLSSLINRTAESSESESESATNASPKLHHRPRAKSVIFCFMSGGLSHVDSFDPKPLLKKLDGQPLPGQMERTQFDANGDLQASHWASKKWGESGLEMTEMFPKIAAQADDIAIVRSMTAKFSEHAQANFFFHTGFPFLGYPSAGAWVAHALGSANSSLPGFVVLRSEKSFLPHGGVSVFGNAFLPATTQGSIFNVSDEQAVAHIQPAQLKSEQRRSLDLIKQLDLRFADRIAARDAVMASVANAETAFEMQAAIPELTDLRQETQATRDLYGVDDQDPQKAQYARQCLTARRLVERGVRFIELSCCTYNIGGGNAGNPWDQHSQLSEGHGRMAGQVDGPIAGLIQDLKQRGLLDETLIVFSGEFGRTPFAQGKNGRDHDPYGFSTWLAGGGIQGGVIYGATDEFGYRAAEKVTSVYDLWATVLHQLGIDHERLTYRHGGRDLRLTDVHGNVWKDLV